MDASNKSQTRDSKKDNDCESGVGPKQISPAEIELYEGGGNILAWKQN